MPGIILRNMPKFSKVTVYGCLSHENLDNISVSDLLFFSKTVNSFMLVDWIKTKGNLSLLKIFYKVRKSITTDMKSEIARRFTLDEAKLAIESYLKNMSEGKVLIKPFE